MDRAKNGKLDFPRFRDALLKMKYKEKTLSDKYALHLFNLLDLTDSGYLTPFSFKFFETWNPPDWMTCEGNAMACLEQGQK